MPGSTHAMREMKEPNPRGLSVPIFGPYSSSKHFIVSDIVINDRVHLTTYLEGMKIRNHKVEQLESDDNKAENGGHLPSNARARSASSSEVSRP